MMLRTNLRLSLSWRTAAAPALGASALLLAVGCGGGSSNGNSGDSVDSLGTDDAGDMGDMGDAGEDGDADGGFKLDMPGGTPDVSSITIEPTDVMVEVVNGAIPAATDFNAVGKLSDGSEVNLDDYGSFTFSRPDVGSMKIQDGVWEATGDVGGQGTVRFEYEDGTIVETTASVKLSYTYDPNATTPGIKDAFNQASTADPAMSMLYPYDETVFPLGLVSPVIQWNGGAVGDVYKITADSTYFSFESFVSADPPSRYSFPDATVLPDDIWVELTESTDGDVSVAVQRYDTANSVAYLPNERTWTIAQANLTGALYYWEVNNGNVVKLKVGDAAPSSFLDLSTTAGGVTCVACHSVSADGSTIVGGTNGSASPWATWNNDGSARFFSATQFGNDWANQDASGFQAISPDGNYVITGQSKGQTSLKLSAADDATSLASLTPPNGQYPVHPAWSPDGQKIAFGVRTDGNWLDFNTSSLWIADVDTQTPGFSNYLEISPVDATLPTSTFPTFSPDSNWVAYNRANMARTRDAITELWMVHADGTNNIELGIANGDNYVTAAESQMNYEPTFLPVAVGGYYWLVFGSERSYGNTLAENTKQLWVAAIDANADGSKDPSHPAFWLPGQELNNQNMRGNWALEPCRASGDSCESGFDCCTGFCVDDGSGMKTCSEDAPECSAEGDACDTAADCCSSTAQCVGGFCAEIIPG